MDPGMDAAIDAGTDLGMDAMVFARVVDAVTARARELGCSVPSYRSPPRRSGSTLRWVRWGGGTPVIGIVRHGRSAVDVSADVIDGIALVNPGIADHPAVRSALVAAARSALEADASHAA
jgi:hypothetical protein